MLWERGRAEEVKKSINEVSEDAYRQDKVEVDSQSSGRTSLNWS